jgi:putative ABC transport system permease protein
MMLSAQSILFRALVWRTIRDQWLLLAAAVATVSLGVALGFGIRLGTESAKVGLEENLRAIRRGGWIGPIHIDSPQVRAESIAPLAQYPAMYLSEVSVTAADRSGNQQPLQLSVFWGASGAVMEPVEKRLQSQGGLAKAAEVLFAPGLSDAPLLLADASCKPQLENLAAFQPHSEAGSVEPISVTWRFEDLGIRSCRTAFAAAHTLGAWVPAPDAFYLKGPTEEAAARDFEANLAAVIGQIPGLRFRSTGLELADLGKLTESMQINLQLMGLVAMLIGIYMVNHVMSAVVTRQSQTFGILNAMGIGFKRQLVPMLGFVGLIGTTAALLGALGGLAVGRVVAVFAASSFQALYDKRLNPDVFDFRAVEFVWAVIAGLVICFIGAFVPLFRLWRLDTAEVLRTGSWHERFSRDVWRRGAIVSLVAVALTILLLKFPFFIGRQPVSAYVACFVMLIGAAGCVRPVIEFSTTVCGRYSQRLLWCRDFRLFFPPQAAVMVQVLLLSFALTIGVRIMSESFRSTLMQWTAATIKADIWVRHAAGAESSLDLMLIDKLRGLKDRGEALAVDGLRVLRARVEWSSDSDPSSAPSDGFPIAISAVSLADQSKVSPLRFVSEETSSQQQLSQQMAEDARSCAGTLADPCSAYFSQSLDVRLGQINKPRNIVTVTVLGSRIVFAKKAVFSDFGNDSGAVLADVAVLERLLGKAMPPGFVNVYLRDRSAANVARIMEEISGWIELPGKASTSVLGAEVLSGSELRARIMTAFEETFAVTDALYVLSGIVACLTVLCSLGLQLLMRSHEWTVLWANGVSVSRLRKKLIIWAGIMSICSYILALPVGIGLGAVLVYVVNYYAFGFDLNLELPLAFLMGLGIVAVVTGLLGGLLTSRRISSLCAASSLNPE